MERTHLSFVAARFLLPVAGSRCLKGRILIELLSIDYIVLDIIIIDWGKKKTLKDHLWPDSDQWAIFNLIPKDWKK